MQGHPGSGPVDDEHSGDKMSGEKRSGIMPLAPEHRPPRFWDSQGSRQMGSQGVSPSSSHQHDHPMPTGMSHGVSAAPMAGQGKTGEATDETAMAHARKHLDATYVCPMHPQEVSNEPGSCSICGMFLVKAGDAKEDRQAEEMGGMEHAMPMQQNVSSEEAAQSMDETAMGHAQKHLDPTYICPMHPQIVQDEPGNCPICGMDLVSRDRVAPASDNPQVFLPAAVIQNMGVRTARAEKRSLGTELRTQGMVTADDDRIRTVHPRAGGWIKTLYLLTEGDRIERKDVLIDFYSPWINQSQIEFIEALEEYDMVSYDPSRKTELAAKVDAKRNALRQLSVSSMDIMRIENSRKVQSVIQMMSPNSGLVTELNVREGAYVEPYQPMFTIVDLSEVWVMLDIYEHQAPWVRKGNHVEITAPAIPGRSWNGMVDFIYPEVDPKTRTLRARIEVSNPDEALLLNMFVQVDLSASAKKHGVLTIPREAVIVTGKREVVIKALGKGHFQPVEIKSGIWSGGQVEILSGLEAGDEIVVSGQFLIDSESSLQASFLRMSE